MNQIDQKLFERIEEYLDGRMDIEEQLAFEVKMKAEPALAEEVELERTLRNSIDVGAMGDTLDAMHEELYGNEVTTPEAKGGFNPWRIAAGIAIILGIGALLFTSGAKDDSLFAEYATVDPGLPVPMSASDTYDFHDAMVDYKTGDYDRAIKTWSALLAVDLEDDTLRYYLAAAYFNKGDLELAMPYFKELSEEGESSFKDKALWYLGLSYLKLDQEVEFQSLMPNDTSPYHARFEEIKERLNN